MEEKKGDFFEENLVAFTRKIRNTKRGLRVMFAVHNYADICIPYYIYYL